MAHLLGAEALHLEYPTKVVFEGLTLGLAEGDRIGVVGRNGDGKSSLLGLLSGPVFHLILPGFDLLAAGGIAGGAAYVWHRIRLKKGADT